MPSLTVREPTLRRSCTLAAGQMITQLLPGDSRPMVELRATITRFAARDAPVLILGETGSGKDLVARALHAQSPRRHLPFTAVNCAAIAPTLAESELFGHTRGAFTGAERRRSGLLTEAGDGTLFLDEVGDLSLPLQAMLLRLLDHGEYRTVGGDGLQHFTGRVLAATHLDLRSLVATGRFRKDLFYRLRVLPIRVPTLDARRDDIPLLVDAILARQRHPIRVAPEALRALREATWPGNVRELEHILECAIASIDGDVIDAAMISHQLAEREADDRAGNDPLISLARAALAHGNADALDAVRAALFAAALELSAGNQSEAARLLRVERKCVERHLKGLAKRGAAARQLVENDHVSGRNRPSKR